MNPVDDATTKLMDSIFIEKIRRARQTPMDEKILDGARLFDMNCRIARDGIRSRFPEFNDEQVEHELDRQLAVARRIADGNIYRSIEESDVE